MYGQMVFNEFISNIRINPPFTRAIIRIGTRPRRRWANEKPMYDPPKMVDVELWLTA